MRTSRPKTQQPWRCILRRLDFGIRSNTDIWLRSLKYCGTSRVPEYKQRDYMHLLNLRCSRMCFLRWMNYQILYSGFWPIKIRSLSLKTWYFILLRQVTPFWKSSGPRVWPHWVESKSFLYIWTAYACINVLYVECRYRTYTFRLTHMVASYVFCVKFGHAQVVQYGQNMRKGRGIFWKMQVLVKINEQNLTHCDIFLPFMSVFYLKCYRFIIKLTTIPRLPSCR